jgi:hypothetical protein
MQTWNLGIDHLIEIFYENDKEKKTARGELTKESALEMYENLLL